MASDTFSPIVARELPKKFLVAFSFAGEQRDLVRSIAEAVEQETGKNSVFFDEWFEYYIAGHGADLKLQEIYGEQSVLAVVCVSEHYGGKPWTQAEHEAIRGRLLKSRGSINHREQDAILPIRVGDGEVKGIPFNALVPDVRERTAGEAAELIVERLRLVAPDIGIGTGHLASRPSWPEAPTPLLWPMANHRSVREAFESLLTQKNPWHFLPIVGPSETGKTHITKQILANALRVPDLACGRFDFKGTTDMETEVRGFVQELGVPLPPAGDTLNERLGHILYGLKQRSRPTLLVFDTYEAAGEAQDWVEKQLLPSLIRATWLRVVIAGQRVPKSGSAIWASVAVAAIPVSPPPPEDWFEFGKQYRPNLTLAEVETACHLARNKASLLAQLLGPVN